jgi:hypothetical protein
MPVFIIFEDTNSHISNKDQDGEMPLHLSIHSHANIDIINQWIIADYDS